MASVHFASLLHQFIWQTVVRNTVHSAVHLCLHVVFAWPCKWGWLSDLETDAPLHLPSSALMRLHSLGRRHHGYRPVVPWQRAASAVPYVVRYFIFLLSLSWVCVVSCCCCWEIKLNRYFSESGSVEKQGFKTKHSSVSVRQSYLGHTVNLSKKELTYWWNTLTWWTWWTWACTGQMIYCWLISLVMENISSLFEDLINQLMQLL